MAKMFISTSFKFKVKSKQNDECVLGGDPLYRQKGINYSNVQFSKKRWRNHANDDANHNGVISFMK